MILAIQKILQPKSANTPGIARAIAGTEDRLVQSLR